MHAARKSNLVERLEGAVKSGPQSLVKALDALERILTEDQRDNFRLNEAD